MSARGEARERRGDYLLAAADYEAAQRYAEQLGARSQTAVLGARLGSALLDAGEAERGERLLREVIEERHGALHDAMPVARLFLVMWLGRTDRVAEAREQLAVVREEFAAVSFPVFDGFVVGLDAWLDAVEGRHEEALAKVRTGLARAADRMSLVIAPHMASVHLVTAAIALAGVDNGRRARDAARCVAAADGLLPPGHVRAPSELEARARAEAAARAALGDAAYEAAYAEGGGLSLEEATALV
jgi:hypothetical protein